MKHRFIALAACALVALTPASLAVAAPMPAVNFPQEKSTLKPDPEVRYGRLPNGFTYVIRKNATPAGTAAISLRVGVGSMMETDTQRGLSHFIEHMAFNGTTHIPEGELKKILERHGFAFGADANAFTSESKTTYKLFAQKADTETLDTSLFILREIAGNMTLNAEAIDRERGVILGEERVRDTPGYRYGTALDRSLFEGQRYANYSRPIGTTDIIKTVSRKELAAFYDAWYRPELTTLVVVGDFDPAQMESRVKAVFSDWKARAAAPAEPDWGPYKARGLRAFTYTEKDLREILGFNWIKPLDNRPDSLDKRIEGLQDNLLFAVLNRRYQKRLGEAGASYLSATAGQGTAFKTARVLQLTITPRPGKPRQAFEQAYDILHSFMEQGVTEQEASDNLNALDKLQLTLVESTKTRANADLANSLLNALDGNGVFLGAEDSLAAYTAAKPKLSRTELNTRLKTLFSGDGPILIHAGETLGDFTDTEMVSDYAAVSELKAAVYKEKERKPWPYTDFGPARAPVEKSVDKDFGYGHYDFGNGVILNVKPTKLTADQVYVQVDISGGIDAFSPKDPRPVALASGSVLIPGGLGKINQTDSRDSLTDKRLSVNFVMNDATTTLSGVTSTADLPSQMQLLTAYVTDPGYRPDGFNRVRTTAPEVVKTYKATPTGVFAYNGTRILRAADPRIDPTILERVKDVKFDDLRSVLAASLSGSRIVVTIVGDVDETKAVTEVGKTFGALPPRPAATPRVREPDELGFPPKDHEFTLYHEGRADQSLSVAIWPATGFYADSKQSRGLAILASVIKNRLYDELREKLGADYTPTAGLVQDDDFDAYGYVEARATIKAGDDAVFRDVISHIAADLKAHPVSDDELLRVKAPIYDTLDNAGKTNAYWLGLLVQLELYGDKARVSRLNRRVQYEGVTAQDLMQLAQKFLVDSAEIHVQVLPTPKPAGAPDTTPAQAPAATPAPANDPAVPDVP